METILIKKNDYSYDGLTIRKTIQNNPDNYSLIEQNGKLRTELDSDYIAIGSIEFVEQHLTYNIPITPNYYPDWAKNILHRKVWKASKFPIGEVVFIKPADKHKRFDGYITNKTYKGKKKPPYWCSDVISFNNEWRLYVSNSEIVYIGWYRNNISIDTIYEIPFPDQWKLEIEKLLPKKYTASVDIGETKYGYSLVECHEPYSCGWYGEKEDGKIYLDWLINGYKYLKNKLTN